MGRTARDTEAMSEFKRSESGHYIMIWNDRPLQEQNYYQKADAWTLNAKTAQHIDFGPGRVRLSVVTWEEIAEYQTKG